VRYGVRFVALDAELTAIVDRTVQTHLPSREWMWCVAR
jgi:hypothetical protein